MSNELPQDIAAEASLLATICAPGCEDMARDIVATMHMADFMHPKHRIMFMGVKELLDKGEEVNLLTLKSIIETGGMLGRVGGINGLSEVLMRDEVGRPRALVSIIQRKRVLRDIIRASSSAIKSAQEEEDPQEILSLLGRASTDLLAGGAGSRMGDSTFEKEVNDYLAGKPLIDVERMRLPAFGLPDIDQELVAPPGSLGIIAAKTSAGKTSLAIQGLVETWRSGRIPAIFSLEMSDEELAGRLVANVADRNSKGVMLGGRTPGPHTELVRMSREIRKIAKIPGRGFDSICAKMREMRATHKTEVFFVDYFTLINPPDMKRQTSVAFQLGEMSKGFKALASNLGVSIVVLSQFNREVVDGQRPVLENLRETGQLEQDASWALMMWTEKPTYQATEIRNVNLEIQKNRGGNRWVKTMASFNPATGRFGSTPVSSTGSQPAGDSYSVF